MRWFLLAILLVSSFVLLGQEQKPEQPEPKRLAAGSGLLWAHIPDCGSLRQDWRKGFLAGLLFDKEMKQFLDKMTKANLHGGRTLKRLVKEQLELDIHELLKGFEGEFLLHLRDIDTQPAARPQTLGDVIKFLFALQVKNAKPVWKKFIEKIAELASLPTKGEQIIKGTKVKWISAPQLRIYYAFCKGLLLGSFDLDTMTQAIERAGKGESATSIYTEPIKKMLAAAEMKSPRIVLRLGIRDFIDIFMPLMGPQERLNFLKTLAGSEFDLSNSVFAAEPLPERGYREVFVMKLTKEAAKTRTVPVTPPQTLLARPEDIYLLSFPAENWAKKIWKTVLERMKEKERRFIPGEGPLSKLKKFEKALGFKIEEFVKNVGRGAIYVVRPAGGGAFPEGFATLNLKDAASFKQQLEKLMKTVQQSDKQLKQKQFVGHTFWVYELKERDRRSPLGTIPWAPTWGVVKEKLLVASSPLMMKSLLKTLRNPKEPNKEFSTFLKRASGAISATYVNLPSIVAYLYNTLIPLLSKKEGRKLKRAGVDLDLLPDAETVSSHFSKLFFFSRRKGDIIYDEIITEKGFGFICDTLTTIGYVFMTALMYEVSERMRFTMPLRMERRVVSALSVLATAQDLYKIEKKCYASSIDALVKGNFLTRESIRTPTHRIKIITADDKSWAAVAEPLPNSPLRRHYYIDQTGTIRYNDKGSADSKSPTLANAPSPRLSPPEK